MWVKLCGIRDVETAAVAAACGADAIGLNFHAPSPRSVDRETARVIAAGLPPGVSPVGVFVNHSPGEIVETVQRVGLRGVQWAGDEPVEEVAAVDRELKAAGVEAWLIRAVRLDQTGVGSLEEQLAELSHSGVTLDAVLVDAKVAGAYGGTGHSPPWDVIRREYRFDRWPRLILAGGLKPGNVSAAIAAVQPFGVDTASGVESAVGCKDPELMRQFVRAARCSRPS
jgi:phosphoribosylanthranilate isomerase